MRDIEIDPTQILVMVIAAFLCTVGCAAVLHFLFGLDLQPAALGIGTFTGIVGGLIGGIGYDAMT